MNPVEEDVPILLGLAEWARRCGRSCERARQVIQAGDVPEAIPLITGHRLGYAVPEGTPWPSRDVTAPAVPLAPLGYLHVGEWALRNNLKPRTVAFNCWLGLFPGAIKHHYHWFVPEDAAYPIRPQGRPRKTLPQDGVPGRQSGTGESLGRHPAPSFPTPPERNSQ